MRTTTTLAICILLGLSLGTALPAIASAPAVIPEGADANMPTSITAWVKCRVAEVRDDSTVVLVDFETETEHVVQLDDTVKIRARKKKDFNGRKKLGFADLREGQTVKVTLLVTDGSIRSITVLERA